MYSTKKLSPEEIVQYSSIFILPIEQTIRWGQFQNACDDRAFIGVFGVFDELGCIVAWANIVCIDMGRYQYLWCKNGPVFVDKFDGEKEEDVIEQLEKYIGHSVETLHATSPQKIDFIRIHTDKDLVGYTSTFASYIKKTQCIDLTQTEDEILKQMKQKGRYNVRVAGKKGVEVIKINSSTKTLRSSTADRQAEGTVKDFYVLLQKTTARDGFQGHPQQYYENMLQYLGEDAALYLAKYEEKYIAGIIVTFAEEVATYYYGASDHDYRKVMAPYLLQWQSIQDAKVRGCKVYDFLGISSSPDDGLSGVTRFKKQFGGYEMEYAAVIDKPLSWRYYVVVVAKKLQKGLQSLRSTIGL